MDDGMIIQICLWVFCYDECGAFSHYVKYFGTFWGIQISNLGDKWFLFRFFYCIDIDRVVNRAPWTFNNHLLVFHRLQVNEDPLLVLLVLLFRCRLTKDISYSDMGWDLTLKAVGRRANDSVWLWKGFEGGFLGGAPSDSALNDGIQPHLVAKSTRMLHPVLSF
ncbi:hypothetical protein J1N35_005090 [Gossypium stocksii]|uniref:DUF4283 domain-containing protein n=1 Tax=Gossypium stocksii TaxID=47602 RepID=A0A9D3WEM3_9ROSI|nr:hypothetical protein J1N35_005090 [Gossypium stocksii]